MHITVPDENISGRKIILPEFFDNCPNNDFALVHEDAQISLKFNVITTLKNKWFLLVV